MRYGELCEMMQEAGWGSHDVLCLKEIRDSDFRREGRNLCTVSNLKRLDTYALYMERGPAPDASEWAGEPVPFKLFEPTHGGTKVKDLKGWIYRDEKLVGFINDKGKFLLCALSDVEGRLNTL